MQLSALNLAAGVGDVEYLTNCIMLHNRLEHEFAEMTNLVGVSRSTNENALKLQDAVKLSDTNKLLKPGNRQCNNLNHTLTDKNQDVG